MDGEVAEVMTDAVRSGPRDVPVSAVAAEFARHDIGSIVIVDADSGKLEGIVTKSDVIELVNQGVDLEEVAVGDVMSSPVYTIAGEDSVLEAAERMRAQDVRRLPVIVDGDLAGVVTTKDITHHLPSRENGRGRPQA